jgi:hypothetical protein
LLDVRTSHFLLLIALSGTAGAAEDSLCDNPEVQPKEECRSAPGLYREHGVVSHIEVARVIARWTGSDDSLEPKYAYFMRWPNGSIVRTEELPSYEGSVQLMINRLGLGYKLIDESLIYDEIIEVIDGRYCRVRAAKRPFVGEEMQCSDHEDIKGSISFAPGTLTAEAARSRVCQVLGHETPASCSALRGSGVFLRRVTSGGEGVLSYEIGVRIRVGERLLPSNRTVSGMEAAPEYDERIYIVSSDTGAVTLQSKATVRCEKNVCQPVLQNP